MSRSSFISREILCVIVRSIQNPRSLLRIAFGMLFVSSLATAATVDVSIINFSFNPPTVSINQGDTVRWTWNGGTHSTTSNTGVWNSGVQSSGTFSFTFTTPATYPYFCTVHGQSMSGTVIVNASPPGTTQQITA